MMDSTISLQTSIGRIAAEDPAFAALLDRLHIDYCCGGEQTLASACRNHDLDPDTVLRLLEASEEMETDAADQPDWTEMSSADLIAHIVETHHAYLREELPRLEELVEKVAAVHGEDAPWLRTVREIFTDLKSELLRHIENEEEIVFPYVLRAESEDAPPRPTGLDGDPIALMKEDHTETGAALARIRRLTDDFEVPAWACPSLGEALERLETLQSDVHAHVHKENNVLFPRAH